MSMKGKVIKIEDERNATVYFKYIGCYRMLTLPTDNVQVDDVVITSNILGSENHDEYVKFIKRVVEDEKKLKY